QAAVEAELAGLNTRWERERDLVTRIREIRAQLETGAEPAALSGNTAQAAAPALDPAALRTELAELNARLDALQGESPLIRVCVDAHIVGDVVSEIGRASCRERV